MYCVYDIYSVGVIQIEVGTSDHFDFDVWCFLTSVGRERFGMVPVGFMLPLLAKLAVLRYYHALSRLAWPYQFLGSVVEFQERWTTWHSAIWLPSRFQTPWKIPYTSLLLHDFYAKKTRPYHITALTVLVHFTGSSQIWRLWLYG